MPNITLGSLVLAANGKTLTGTLAAGSGSGYLPASGVTGFTVKATMGTIPQTEYAYASAVISGTTLMVTLYAAVVIGQVVTLSYTSGNVTDSGSNALATITNASVTNNTTVAAPAESRPGVYVPAGSLNNYKEAKALSSSQPVEVVVFGDSTTEGSGPTPLFSWLEQTRAAMIAAGKTDGGHGVIVPNDLGHDYTQFSDGTVFVSNSGTWNAGGFLMGGDPAGGTGAGICTFAGRGVAARLIYSLTPSAGQFSYRVDGGTWNTVNPYRATTFNADAVYVSGLASGAHTLEVRNDNGAPYRTPTVVQCNPGGSGPSMPAGTFYYVATGVTGSGETLPSVTPNSRTTGAGSAIQVIIGNSDASTHRLYRSTSAVGPFYFLAEFAGGVYVDTNSPAPDGVTQPPSVYSAGLNPAINSVSVLVEFLPAAGIVLHNYGVSGASTQTFFHPAIVNPGEIGNIATQVALGLTTGTTGLLHDYEMPADTKPQHRDVKLAVFALGINDQQGGAAGSPDTSPVTGGLIRFFAMARQTGADPLVVIPHYRLALFNDRNASTFIADTKAACVAAGVAYVDFNQVLADNDPNTTPTAANYFNIYGSVHATKATYQLEGDFAALYGFEFTPSVRNGQITPLLGVG